MQIFGAVVLLSVTLAMPAVAQQQVLTKEQADAILKELREIRKLLEQMQRASPARATLVAPQPTSVKVRLNNGYALGRQDAPLTLVEFTDYQCGYCRRFHLNVFEELKKNFVDTGQVRFISRDLPLTNIHPHAFRAAMAGRCAGEQEKFWEMRHILISNANNLDPAAILDYAQQAGLDTRAFQGCLDSKKYEQAVQTDIMEADSLGVNGTPTFVLGETSEDFEGVKIVGAQPYSAFESRIKQLLEQRKENQ